MANTHVEDIVNHPSRIIGLAAVHNFRDLGGYPTASGHITKWRTLFRSDGLHRLRDADDLDQVQQLGLKAVIDLRTEREQREQGIFPTADIAVDFHHLSIVDVTWSDTKTPEFDDEVEFLVWGYRDMLEIGSGRFADAMNVLAQANSLPAVFHCAAGKDRTGILAALLLSSIGVDDAHITADYGLTQDAVKRTIAWARIHRPEMAERYASIPQAYLAADPRAMQIILTELAQQHGSVRNYVREIGVADSTVYALSDLLLEPR